MDDRYDPQTRTLLRGNGTAFQLADADTLDNAGPIEHARLAFTARCAACGDYMPEGTRVQRYRTVIGGNAVRLTTHLDRLCDNRVELELHKRNVPALENGPFAVEYRLRGLAILVAGAQVGETLEPDAARALAADLTAAADAYDTDRQEALA